MCVVVVCEEFAQLVMMSLCTKYAVSVIVLTIYSVRASSLFIPQLPQIACEFFVQVENLKAQLVQIRMKMQRITTLLHYVLWITNV